MSISTIAMQNATVAQTGTLLQASWFHMNRNVTSYFFKSSIISDKVRFKGGMKRLTDKIHALGLYVSASCFSPQTSLICFNY